MSRCAKCCFFLECRDPKPLRKGRGVSLVVSLSEEINKRQRIEFAKCVGAKWMYELCATAPGDDVISSTKDLEEFRRAYEDLIDVIKSDYPRGKRISAFISAPASAVVEIYRMHMSDVNLTVDVYERCGKSYVKALEIGNIKPNDMTRPRTGERDGGAGRKAGERDGGAGRKAASAAATAAGR